jgi:hypothetical protein
MDVARTPFIGVVSDTHGYYDPALDEVLCGAECIVHAGDVGAPDVLSCLAELAPVVAVLGNTDLPSWDGQLPWEREAEVLGLRILVCHISQSLMGRHDPVAEGYDLVVSGHSHRAAVEWREDTLFLNPGAAGKARFGLSPTCARVTVGTDGRPVPEIVPLG